MHKQAFARGGFDEKPPPVTRGCKILETALKNGILSEKIDWLAYSFSSQQDWQFPGYIEDKWKDISPLRNYTNGQENKQGVKRFWNTHKDKQGRFVLLSGSVLPTLEENVEPFLRHVASLDAKPTRIDFCVDITHSNFNPKQVIGQLRSRNVITHAKKIPRYTDDWQKGFTQYVGTKSSETYTRIYDKGVEQKTDFSWTRIETVYQGDRAEAALQAYLLHKSTRPLIRAHVDFPKWKAWGRIMQSDKAKLTIAPKQSNTRRWLMESVCGTIAKELLLDEDQAFLFELIDRIRLEYRTLSGE